MVKKFRFSDQGQCIQKGEDTDMKLLIYVSGQASHPGYAWKYKVAYLQTARQTDRQTEHTGHISATYQNMNNKLKQPKKWGLNL